MHLQKLEITGFKSFAQKTVIVFPEPTSESFGITAVVGPNGSGKSNVIDAVCWGLGEQSFKNLRSKNIDNIFFAGSQNNKTNFAEVSLSFINEKNNKNIENLESKDGGLSDNLLDGEDLLLKNGFTITRRVYRNSENDYLINNNKVRLQDIVYLLARCNFGQKSYSLVNQGMTDAILRASGPEKKIFLNEATGVEQYNIKKTEAERKIKKSQENLSNALIALGEITPRLNSLKRQINKLNRRQEIEEQLQILQRDYYANSWNILHKEILESQKNLADLDKRRIILEEKLKIYQQKLDAFGQEKIDKNYIDLQSEYRRLNEQKNSLIQQSERCKFELEKVKTTAQNQKINLRINIVDLQNGLLQIEKNFSQLLENNDLASLHSELKKILVDIQKILEAFQNQNPNPAIDEQQIEVKKKQIDDNSLAIDGLSRDIDALQAKLDGFLSSEKEKRSRLVNEQKERQAIQDELNALSDRVNDIKIEIAKNETKKNALEEEARQEAPFLNINESVVKLSKTDLDVFTLTNKNSEIKNLKHLLEQIGSIDPEIEKEYQSCYERNNFLEQQTKDMEASIRATEEIVDRLDQKIKESFQKNLSKINHEFNRFFKILFNGGEAEIKIQTIKKSVITEVTGEETSEKNDLSDNQVQKEEQIIEEQQIDIIAHPPAKRIKNIEMLSGGEKALTSLALICAIIAINKPPFVILDEADAALDEKNSTAFGRILKELAKKTQLIIISHNAEIMQISDILYGATVVPDGSTRLLSLKIEN